MAQDHGTKIRRALAFRHKAKDREREFVPSGPAPDIWRVDPQPERIVVTHHAAEQFDLRVKRYCGEQNPHDVLMRVVCTGRRSDRDRKLKSELEPWIRFVTWKHQGRPVTLFFEQATRIGAMAVLGHEEDGRVIVLTCFSARDGDAQFE